MKLSALAASSWLLLAFAACSSSTLVATPTYDAGAPPPTDDASTDDGGEPTDAKPADDGAPPVFPNDGPPSRLACTDTFGNGLTPSHGRLDGVLVSVVSKNAGSCPSDATHVHLQVKMNNAVYDIAVNIDGYEGEVDAPLPGGAYAEGWHPDLMDYVTDLGVHSSEITLTGQALVRARVVDQLTNANHISVFGTGYAGSDGAHLIHRNPTSHDGAIALDPLSPTAHFLVFRFEQDTF